MMVQTQHTEWEENALADDPLYGAFLRIRAQLCTVVGGGHVAARKVRKLLDAGALVRVISPRLTPDLEHAAAVGHVQHVARPFASGDTVGALLVFAATDDRAVNRQVAAEVTARGGLVNVVDDAALCTFMVPATFADGGLQVAISTGGRDPRSAKRMRAALARDIATGTADFIAAARAYDEDVDAAPTKAAPPPSDPF